MPLLHCLEHDFRLNKEVSIPVYCTITIADTSIVEQVESEETGGLEPPGKKMRIQHQDGQTYILAVTGWFVRDS